MKHFLSFLAICVIASTHSNGQSIEKKVITAGQKVSAFSYNLYPSFKEGIVKLKDGRDINAKMNFSLASCQIQYINSKGDTLTLDKLETVDSIYLNGSVFFYVFKKGYFQIPNDSSNPVRLAILRKTSYEPVKIGVFGVPERSASIENFATYNSSVGPVEDLTVNVDIYVNCRINYYFLGKRYAGMIEASKSGVMETIPKKNKEAVEEYIKTNKKNFTNEKDLQKLLQFCNDLSTSKKEIPLILGS